MSYIKLFTSSFVFLSIVLFNSACERPIEQRLIGKWDYAESGIYIVNSIFVSDTTQISSGATLTFKAGGAGTFWQNDSTYKVEWSANSELVTLQVDSLDPVEYEVILNTDNQQFWLFEKEKTTSENGVDTKEEWSTTVQLKKL